MFRNFYYYLYIDLLNTKLRKTAAFDAHLNVSVFQILNISSFLPFINLSWTKTETSIFAFIAFVIVTGFNYFFLYKKFEIIKESHKNDTPEKIKRGLLYYKIYQIISAIIFVYVLFHYVKQR